MQVMKARRIIDVKEVRPDGLIIQMVVWQLPEKTPQRPHGLKYRLFCGNATECLVRYDNEAGKGDHRHYGTREEPYSFEGLSQLITSFRADVRRLTGDDNG
jgi:uncharacterized protein YwbE